MAEFTILLFLFLAVQFICEGKIYSLSTPTHKYNHSPFFRLQLLSTSLIKLNSLCNGSRLFQLGRQWGNEKYQVQYGSEDFEI